MLIEKEAVTKGNKYATRKAFSSGSMSEAGGDVNVSLTLVKFISTMYVTVMCESS